MSRARTRRKNRGNKVRVEFKWNKPLIFLLSALLIMLVVTIILYIPTKSERLTSDFNDAMTTQTSLSSDNVFVEISHKKLLKQIQKDEFTIVYYGSESNANFLTYLETINIAADDHEIDTVYYYSSEDVEEIQVEITETEDDDEKAELYDEIEELEDELLGLDLEVIPSLWVFRNGEVYTYTGDSGDSSFVLNSDEVLSTDELASTLSGWDAMISRFFSILGYVNEQENN